jgi:hypothetical protein
MMSQMEGDLRGYRRERFSAEEKALAELEDKVSDLQHDEAELQRETDQVRERQRKAARERMRGQLDGFIKQARQQVSQLKQKLDSVESKVLTPYENDELRDAKQRTDDLDRQLQATDLEEARAMAREAQGAIDRLEGDLRDEDERAWGVRPRAGTQKARERVNEAGKMARKLASDLEQAMPKPGELMSPEDQKRLGELEKRQNAVRRRAQEVGRDLAGKEGKPALPPQLGEKLREAGQHMERAEGELRRRDARDASGEEGQALEQLGKMKEQLQRERRPREGMAGARPDKEPVRIPGADEYRAPKEFRQDILDAMKRSAPAQYRELVKKYYEELVR